MVCTNCGALIPTDSFQCAECGKRKTPTEVLEEPPGPPTAPPLEGVGGWLLILIAYLVFLLPLRTLLGFFRVQGDLAGGQSMQKGFVLHTLIPWIAILCVAGMGLYAGIALWKVLPGAVRATKRFLFALLLFETISALVSHRAMSDRAWGLADDLLFFFVWYSYLVLSKRVANTYPRAPRMIGLQNQQP